MKIDIPSSKRQMVEMLFFAVQKRVESFLVTLFNAGTCILKNILNLKRNYHVIKPTSMIVVLP